MFCNNNNLNVTHIESSIFPLKQVKPHDDSVRFLGVLFDTDLNFKNHITSITTKISRGIYALRTAKKFLNPRSLKMLYYSLIHCYLIYGIQV